MSSSQKRIAGALLAGAALIAGALLIRAYTEDNTPNTAANIAVVTEAPERTSIKTLDENNDGVPDWQEALLVTKALQIASTTSDYTEPETLTEKFAIEFFQDMVRAENYGAFGDTPEELVAEAGNELSKQVVDILFTSSDVHTSSDNSPEALSAYGETVARITTLYTEGSGENEAAVLARALRNQDPSELDILDGKIETYENILRDTQALTVPSNLQREHLNLLNSYRAVLTDIQAMRAAFSDPMLTLLRMKRYQDDIVGMTISFKNIYTKLIKQGASWDADSAVMPFIAIQ